MPFYQTIFKDTHPVLYFSKEWSAITSENDPLLDQYGERTATATNATGATMTMRFFGNHVAIIGAKRPEHGLFSVTIDGKTFPSLNASSPTPLFNQTLFDTTLDNAQHTVVMTNLGNGTTLDVDYVAFDSFIGTADEKIGSDTFQDDHPTFQYIGKWAPVGRPGTFSGSSGHRYPIGVKAYIPGKVITSYNIGHYAGRRSPTNTPLCSGSALLLYGTITPTACAAYSVSVDGGPFEIYSARRRNAKPRQIFYHRNGLGAGTHTVVVQFNTTDNTTIGDFDLDFSNIWTLPSLGGSLYTVKPLDFDSNDKLPRSAIIGLSIASVVAFLALLGVSFLLFKQSRQSKRGKSGSGSDSE